MSTALTTLLSYSHTTGMCPRGLAEKAEAMGKGKVRVKGQTHATPYRTRNPVTALERWPVELIFPKSQATSCSWRWKDWQHLAKTNRKLPHASTHTFSPNLGDEFFFDVMLWDKSLLFFCSIWRQFGASLGRRETSHTRHSFVPSRLRADVRSDQVKASQGLLETPQSWTSQLEGRMPLESWALAGLQQHWQALGQGQVCSPALHPYPTQPGWIMSSPTTNAYIIHIQHM